MNLTLKPEKCKNLSICSGSPKIVPFSLGGKDLDSIKNSPMQFLGACVSFQSTSMEGFTFIHNKLESMLKNIESTNTVVPALGDPCRERPPAVYGRVINVPTHFNVKLPVIGGHLPNADADSHLLVVRTCYNGQCKQMQLFGGHFNPN